MARINITEQIASRVKPGTTNTRYTDQNLLGFGLRVNPKGTKAWFVTYRSPTTKTVTGEPVQREQNIGTYPEMSVKDARQRATEIKLAVKRGEDPFAPAVALTGPTITEYWETKYRRHGLSKKEWKAKTVEGYDTHMRVWVTPEWGSRPISSIKFEDVNALHEKIGTSGNDGEGAKYMANGMVRLVRAMMKHAILHKAHPGPNPAEGVEMYKEHKRKRRLSKGEIARLWNALDWFERECTHYNANNARAVRALLLTPNRKMEVVEWEWDWIKDHGIEVPDSKTGEIRVPLTTPLREHLESIPKIEGNPFVFTSTVKKGDRMYCIDREAWAMILEHAEITGLRIHDLRRSVASFALNILKLPLKRIGAALNQTCEQTMNGYALLEDETKAEDMEAISATIIDLATKRKEKAA